MAIRQLLLALQELGEMKATTARSNVLQEVRAGRRKFKAYGVFVLTDH